MMDLSRLGFFKVTLSAAAATLIAAPSVSKVYVTKYEVIDNKLGFGIVHRGLVTDPTGRLPHAYFAVHADSERLTRADFRDIRRALFNHYKNTVGAGVSVSWENA